MGAEDSASSINCWFLHRGSSDWDARKPILHRALEPRRKVRRAPAGMIIVLQAG